MGIPLTLLTDTAVLIRATKVGRDGVEDAEDFILENIRIDEGIKSAKSNLGDGTRGAHRLYFDRENSKGVVPQIGDRIRYPRELGGLWTVTGVTAYKVSGGDVHHWEAVLE